MSTPRQFEFWQDEERRLWDKLSPDALTILFTGAQSGADLLPKGVAVLIDWDVVNDSVLAFLNKYRLYSLGKVNETTRTRTVKAIDDWIRGGEPLPMLEKRLEPWYGERRAKMVASTEVTRLFAEGNLMSWKATGLVSGKRWQTARDERVCPLCGPLHNTVVELDADAFGGDGGIGVYAPPLHPRCRCWLQPITDEDLLRKELQELEAQRAVDWFKARGLLVKHG